MVTQSLFYIIYCLLLPVMISDDHERVKRVQSLVTEVIEFSTSGHTELFAKAMFEQVPEVSQEWETGQGAGVGRDRQRAASARALHHQQ